MVDVQIRLKMNTQYNVNQYNPDILECHSCGKHAMKGECIYLSTVPCKYRGKEPNYACKIWFSRNERKEDIKQKSDPRTDTQVDM